MRTPWVSLPSEHEFINKRLLFGPKMELSDIHTTKKRMDRTKNGTSANRIQMEHSLLFVKQYFSTFLLSFQKVF